MLQSFTAQLIQKTQLTEDVFLFRFNLNNSIELNFLGGQYLILNIPKNDTTINRLYSIASPVFEKNSFELVIKIIPGGETAQYLNILNVGDSAQFEGPAGVFTLKENNKDKILLMTGTGIAPARSMICSLLNLDLKCGIYLFWGLPNFKDVFFFEELKRLAFEHKNFNFHICLSREQNLEMVSAQDRQYFSLGHVDRGCIECMSKVLETMSNSQKLTQFMQSFEYYLCGSPEVVESLRKKLYDHGVDKENVIFEKF